MMSEELGRLDGEWRRDREYWVLGVWRVDRQHRKKDWSLVVRRSREREKEEGWRCWASLTSMEGKDEWLESCVHGELDDAQAEAKRLLFCMALWVS